MLISEIIRAKRDGHALSEEEIRAMVAAIADDSASEGQVAAFAMAVFWRGMTPAEAAIMTLAMRDSGDVFNWDLPGPVVDKHSTGGVGDNVSLMLAPIVAACGGYVPMISGRGLGHTGGTLDKMDAIPGYSSQPDNETFRRVVAETGCAIIGQTGHLAPADKRFYGIRDVTATVESVPLITASILSKKLAAGLGSLVMDVKCGNGAFMATESGAEELARSLVRTAGEAGLPCTALITDMNQPLASVAGNALEVENAVAFLTGTRRDARLEDVVLALAGEMLTTAGLTPDREAGRERAGAALASGDAAEVFGRMVAALGGPSDFVEKCHGYLPVAPIVRPVQAQEAGHVTGIQTRDVGLAVVELGGGRRRADDRIDLSVGITDIVPIGTKLAEGDPIAVIHAASEEAAALAEAQLRAAYALGDKPKTTAPVLRVIEG